MIAWLLLHLLRAIRWDPGGWCVRVPTGLLERKARWWLRHEYDVRKKWTRKGFWT